MRRILLALLLSCLGVQAQIGQFNVHNTSGSCTMSVEVYRAAGSFMNSASIAPGATATIGFVYSSDNPIRCDVKVGGTLMYSRTVTVTTHPQTEDFSSCTAPASTYYMNGCVTNNTGFVTSFSFKFSDGFPAQNSGPIVPGGIWCISRTNASPFTYTATRTVYNSDGGTNEWFVSDPYSAWTNNPPPIGASGSTAPPGSPITQNPGAGQNNTNGVTGDQFSKGLKDLLDAMWQGFQMLMGKKDSGAVVVGGTNNAPDYTGHLTAIMTNTDAIRHAENFNGMALFGIYTNTSLMLDRLDAISTNTGGGAYLAWLTNNSGTGFLGLSNDVWGGIAIGSNAMYQAVADNSGAITAVSEVSSTHADSFWKIPGVYNSVAKFKANDPAQAVDWNPQNVWIWDFMGWVKVCATWGLAFFGMYYVRALINSKVEVAYRVPGGNPGKGGALGWFTWVRAVALHASIFAAVPIALAAALQTVLTDTGTDMSSGPLSAGSINAHGGRTAAAIHEAIWLVNQAFPIAYAIGLAVYLWFFSLTVDTWLAVSTRLQRAFGN